MTDHTERPGFVAVGNILKSHGIKGEVIVDPEIDFPEQLERIELFFVENDRGDLQPMRVESASVKEKGNRPSFFVKFEQVINRSMADDIRYSSLFVSQADFETFDEAEDELGDLIGLAIVDENGEAAGEITDALHNGVHVLLTVEHAGAEYFVPMVDEFISAHPEKEDVLLGRNLSQFMELNQ